jgi:phosphatidylserine synthase
MFGDAIDGWVARKLNSANAFGAEYDAISDHLSHLIAPALIVYTVYADSNLVATPPVNEIIGGILAGVIITAATIRHARNVVKPVNVTGVWSGLPRTILGFMVMGFVLSASVAREPRLLWLGLAFIPLASLATLSRVPFTNHRLPRHHRQWARAVGWTAFALLLVTLVVYPRALFDVLLVSQLVFCVVSSAALGGEKLSEYRAAVKLAQKESR